MTFSETLVRDEELFVLFADFMRFYNENIDWKATLRELISKKKSDEQFISYLRSLVWIDQDLEVSIDKTHVYREIIKSLFEHKINENENIVVLDLDKTKLPMKVEYEFLVFEDCLLTALKSFYSRLGTPFNVVFKRLSEIEPSDVVISTAWFLDDFEEIKEKKNIKSFRFNNLEIGMKNKYISFIREVYLDVFADLS